MLQTIAALSVAVLLGAAPIAPPVEGTPLLRGSTQFHLDYGTFSQYNRGPTDSQIWYHTQVTGLLKPGQGYQGMIAVVDCDLVGKDAWVRVKGSDWLKVFVFDCSGHVSTTRWMIDNDIPAELGWYLVEKLGLPHGVGVPGAITYQDPTKGGDVIEEN